jgi:hypothetical protein
MRGDGGKAAGVGSKQQGTAAVRLDDVVPALEEVWNQSHMHLCRCVSFAGHYIIIQIRKDPEQIQNGLKELLS